jgi:hypothetical protein
MSLVPIRMVLLTMRRAETNPVAHAIADLCTLAQADHGVLEAIACGTAAVPPACAAVRAEPTVGSKRWGGCNRSIVTWASD